MFGLTHQKRHEKNKRDIKSLYFIKKYFEEYKEWLLLVSFYKKNKY